MRSYGGEVTDFHDKEIPKVGSNYTFLAAISLDFSQVILKECKYIEKEIKLLGNITEGIESFSNNSDEE